MVFPVRWEHLIDLWLINRSLPGVDFLFVSLNPAIFNTGRGLLFQSHKYPEEEVLPHTPQPVGHFIQEATRKARPRLLGTGQRTDIKVKITRISIFLIGVLKNRRWKAGGVVQQ